MIDRGAGRPFPEIALAALRNVVLTAPVFESERDEARDVVKAILDLAESLQGQ